MRDMLLDDIEGYKRTGDYVVVLMKPTLNLGIEG